MTHRKFIKKYLRNIDWYMKGDILCVDDDLDFQYNNIRSLPDNLYIKGSLNLNYASKITSLSRNLSTDWWVDLQRTNITSLPEGLSVGYYLNLYETEIISLPDDLLVNDVIYSDNELLMCEHLQLIYISRNDQFFNIIKDPTEKAKTLQKLLYKI